MSHRPSPLPSPGAGARLGAPSPNRTSLDVPRPQVLGGPGFLSPQSSTESLRPPPSYSSRWLGMDSRLSSTQSLVSSELGDASGDHRRRLLVIYIHGFYGNDTSFKSFPAHVHSYLTNALAESHVVHSKVYPR